MVDEQSATDLLTTSIIILCVASAAIGAILQYCRDAMHFAHQRPIHDWLLREAQAWRRFRKRTRRRT